MNAHRPQGFRPQELSQVRNFKPAGPVSAAFIGDDTSVVPTLLGPVGGGKSVACVYKGIRRASLMPVCNDGVIRYRRAIVGTTYGQIERNLYPTWKRWLPEDGGDITQVAEWKGGGGRSATHRLEWEVVRGHTLVPVMAEFVFAAVGEQSVEDFVRGFEPTDFWFYEMDLLPRSLLEASIPRLGRFPAVSNSEPDALSRTAADSYTPQICGDLNAPDIDSWFYEDFEEKPVPGYRLYKQPSGLSPKAENRANLRSNYYDVQVAVLSKRQNGKNLVKRMVHAQYAPSPDGQPVYEEYSDDLHLLPTIAPVPDVPLTLGFDQGLRRPACVGFQDLPTGQCRVLFEVVPGRMNARRFAEHVRLKIAEVAPGIPLAEIHWCDPAGTIGADQEAGDLAWNEIVAVELGIVIMGTETNEIEARTTAVSDDLTYMIDAQTPGIVISREHCPMLRKGFASHYRYRKERVGTGERTSDKPEKTDESNPHDALQYGRLGVKGRVGAIAGPRDARDPARAIGQRRTHADAGDACVVVKSPVDFG